MQGGCGGDGCVGGEGGGEVVDESFYFEKGGGELRVLFVGAPARDVSGVEGEEVCGREEVRLEEGEETRVGGRVVREDAGYVGHLLCGMEGDAKEMWRVA